MLQFIQGIVSGVITSAVIAVLTAQWNTGRHFGGIAKFIRYVRDSRSAGVVNIFASRSSYHQHRDHGTAAEYISKCGHSLYYVGYWLAGSVSIGNVVNEFRRLAEKQVSITLVFVDPSNDEIMNVCSKYLNTSTEELKNNVMSTIDKIMQLKNSLKPDQRKYITVKVHHVPLSTSAFIIEQSDPEDSVALLDYKLYGKCRDDSYGIEYKNKKNIVTKKVFESYLQICEEAEEYSPGN